VDDAQHAGHVRWDVTKGWPDPSDRIPIISAMEATLRLLAWAGVVAAASVATALAVGLLFGSI